MNAYELILHQNSLIPSVIANCHSTASMHLSTSIISLLVVAATAAAHIPIPAPICVQSTDILAPIPALVGHPPDPDSTCSTEGQFCDRSPCCKDFVCVALNSTASCPMAVCLCANALTCGIR